MLRKKELSRHEIKTAGDPAAIRLTLMQAPDGFKADGADLVLVEVEVVDKEGIRHPLANDLISFELTGPAEWRGGIAQGPDNYILSTDLPVECGVNRAFIRSTTKSGKVTLKATAAGLSEATLTFNAIPFKQNNGLSTYISGDYQPSHLSRGATPATPAFKPSRRNVKIVDAMAGAHEEQARTSFDDNERTTWENDGRLRTGWIIYELERDAEVAEIDLKLSGWRRRSYPIRIFVDDKEVYTGNTPQSLGYISIPITPTQGRFVKIQLSGASSEEDAFGGLVEVTGKIESDVVGNKNTDAKGQLAIVEIDIHEAIR